MEDTVYILIEQHRYITPRRFSIIAVFDNLEAATKECTRYNRYIPCNEYAYEIKVEEWKLKN